MMPAAPTRTAPRRARGGLTANMAAVLLLLAALAILGLAAAALLLRYLVLD